MIVDQQPAYILHARAYRETSLLLECLTCEHGRLGMVARGVRGGRSKRLSASGLQPFQAVALSFSLRGELATLRGAEPLQRPLRLADHALPAGLYVNELIVRLSARQDPHPGLYELYARTLRELCGEASLAWTLRRFERDFLAALGYAMQLECDADDGMPLLADADYVYVPEQGAVRAAGQSGPQVRGRDLLDLSADRRPDAAGMEHLRRLLRAVLLHRLGGRPPKSWAVFARRRTGDVGPPARGGSGQNG